MAGAREHPKLTEARERLKAGDVSKMVGLAAGSVLSRDRGDYCDCKEPLLEGDDLMCGACLRSSRSQEVARIQRAADAHDFDPSDRSSSGLLCGVCALFEHHPRHHGEPGHGTTSWGSTVVGRPLSDEGER